MFRNPGSGDIFSDLNREFARMGLRFDPQFFDHLFFGGRGVYFRGVVFGGPGGIRLESFDSRGGFSFQGATNPIPPLEQIFIPKGTGVKGRLVSWAGRKLFGFLLKRIIGKPENVAENSDLDLAFALPMGRKEAAGPAVKEVSYRLDGRTETLRVRIPPGVQDGMTLRLRGKGKRQGQSVGDLFLKVKLK
jgi:hypothetical protein